MKASAEKSCESGGVKAELGFISREGRAAMIIQTQSVRLIDRHPRIPRIINGCGRMDLAADRVLVVRSSARSKRTHSHTSWDSSVIALSSSSLILLLRVGVKSGADRG